MSLIVLSSPVVAALGNRTLAALGSTVVLGETPSLADLRCPAAVLGASVVVLCRTSSLTVRRRTASLAVLGSPVVALGGAALTELRKTPCLATLNYSAVVLGAPSLAPLSSSALDSSAVLGRAALAARRWVGTVVALGHALVARYAPCRCQY